MKLWRVISLSESGFGLLDSSPGKFWEEKVDDNGGGGAVSYGFSYTYTLVVTIIILFCHLINKFRSHRIRSSSSSNKSSGKIDVVSRFSGPSDPPVHISSSQFPQSRISTIITDSDLKNLIDDLDEKVQCTERWEHVIDRRDDLFSYTAKCCKLKDGPHKYLSVTLFENCSIEMLRDFYMDNDFRQKWDRTLAGHGQLQVDPDSGTEIGWMVKKFPLMTPREYVLAWKMWEGNDGSFYCLSKECEHPLIPRQKKYVRVALFRSGWRIRAVPGRNACEIKMVHQEDSGMNVEMARLAFAKGIWSYVCKMHTAFRKYSTIGRHSKPTSGASAITLIQKVPPELNAISNSTNTKQPETSTSSDHLPLRLPDETGARKLSKKPSIKLMKNAVILIGGVICLSRGHSNLGVFAMACILGKLKRQNASSFNKDRNPGNGGLTSFPNHEDSEYCN